MNVFSKKIIIAGAGLLLVLVLVNRLAKPQPGIPQVESEREVLPSQLPTSTPAATRESRQSGRDALHEDPPELSDHVLETLLETAKSQDRQDPLHDAPRPFLYRLDADELEALYQRSLEGHDFVTAGIIVTIRTSRMMNSGQSPDEQVEAANQLMRDVAANPGLLASKDLASFYLGGQYQREPAERAMKLVQTHNAAYFKARESCFRYDVEFNIASYPNGTAIPAPSPKAKDYYIACVLASLERGESVQQIVIAHSTWLRRSLGLNAAKRFFDDQSQRYGIRLPDEQMKMLLGE